MLWTGQCEIVDTVSRFLEEVEQRGRPMSLFLFFCKEDGTNRIGPGVSTALAHALCGLEKDILWCYASNEHAQRALDRLESVQQELTPSWDLLQKMDIHSFMMGVGVLRYMADSGLLYSRSLQVMKKRSIPCTHHSHALTVFDDITWDSLGKALYFSLIFGGLNIFAITLRESELSAGRQFMDHIRNESFLFSAVDFTHWLERARRRRRRSRKSFSRTWSRLRRSKYHNLFSA